MGTLKGRFKFKSLNKSVIEENKILTDDLFALLDEEKVLKILLKADAKEKKNEVTR